MTVCVLCLFLAVSWLGLKCVRGYVMVILTYFQIVILTYFQIKNIQLKNRIDFFLVSKGNGVWSGNTTITHCKPTHGTARKGNRALTVTRHQEDNCSRATSYLYRIKIIAGLEGHYVLNNKTRTKHRTPINNESKNKQ